MSTQAGGYQEFSFDQGDEGVGSKGKRFKAEKDHTYRVSFIWWDGLKDGTPDMTKGAPRFVGANTHFIAGAGYVINQGPEFTKLAGSPPRQRIGTIIVVWPTDKQGIVLKDKIGDAEVFSWIFSNDKYGSLKQIHHEFGFGDHDITLKCSDSQYQKMTFSPCKESLLRKLLENPKGESILKRIIEEAQGIEESIQNEVGRKLTIAQVKDKLAGGSGTDVAGGSTAGAVADGDLDNLVDNILG